MDKGFQIPESMLEAIEITVSELTGGNIRYALIGGLATGYRTQPRFTRDLDFLLTVPQIALPQLLTKLASRGVSFDMTDTIREWTQHHIAVLSYQGVRIDWLKPLIPAYAHVLDRATEEPWLNRTIHIAAPEGLILMKLIAFRGQDQLDIQTLIQSNRGSLDIDWIRAEWQSIADLSDPRMQRFEAWLAGSADLA